MGGGVGWVEVSGSGLRVEVSRFRVRFRVQGGYRYIKHDHTAEFQRVS